MTENRSGCEMKSVAGWSASSSGPRSAARSRSVPSVGRDDRDREADRQCDQRPARQREPAVDERDADARQRAELGPDDHRADDQDHRVGQDPDAGDQRREHHEGEEAARELGALGGAALDLLPDDGVGGRAGGGVLGGASGSRDRGVDRLDCDRALLGEAEVAQLRKDDARVFARDVAEDHVTARRARRTREVDDVDHGRLAARAQRGRARRARAGRPCAGGSSARS